MKRISKRLMFAVTLLYSAALGQQYPPPIPQPFRLQDDQEFRRLPREEQIWARETVDKLNAEALERNSKPFHVQWLDPFRSQLMGKSFCDNNAFTQATYLDALQTTPETHIFAVRWLDPAPAVTIVHTALFTDSRCVARDGAVIDGKRISRIIPNSLAVSSQHGLVAYCAIYSYPADPLVHRVGVFIENRYIVDLDPASAATLPDDHTVDFWWRSDSEQLNFRPDVRLPAIASDPN